MEKLIEGLHRFRARVAGSNQQFFQQLVRGQHPSTLFITCSDSRINPNLITQTGPGELFIIRNAGCLIPPYSPAADLGGEAATIEYAICVLRVDHIVVCGHSHCGAMSAIALDTPLHGLPALRSWLQHAETTRALIDKNYGHLTGPQRVMATVQENVLVQMEHLRTHPSVIEVMERDALSLHGWVYEIETGDVFTYDPTSGQFLPLSGSSPRLPRLTHADEFDPASLPPEFVPLNSGHSPK